MRQKFASLWNRSARHYNLIFHGGCAISAISGITISTISFVQIILLLMMQSDENNEFNALFRKHIKFVRNN